MATNPYIDYNLLRAQSQFTIEENAKFECDHTISLNSMRDKRKKKETKLIVFKWNEKVKYVYECDGKHLLYLIYLALIKIEKRQIEKNKYYVRKNHSDRVMDLVDKKEIMTNLITWMHQNPEKNELNGYKLKKMKAREFINNVLTINGGEKCTMGLSTKIYGNLVLDPMNIKDVNGFVEIPNYKYFDV